MFLEDLEEYQKLEEGQKKFKFPVPCKNCGKVFENRHSSMKRPTLTCSKKCYKENLSKINSGKKSYNPLYSNYFIKKSIQNVILQSSATEI